MIDKDDQAHCYKLHIQQVQFSLFFQQQHVVVLTEAAMNHPINPVRLQAVQVQT